MEEAVSPGELLNKRHVGTVAMNISENQLLCALISTTEIGKSI